jgi:hypothetical protein
MNVKHTVAAADKPNLEAIISNDKAASSVKTLAGVILNLHHMASDSDKAKLQVLIQYPAMTLCRESMSRRSAGCTLILAQPS